MSKHKGWTGATVRKARNYWGQRILTAYMAGEPLLCSFAARDPQCPGVIVPADTWHVDHVTPRGEGGHVTRRSNQWPAHEACNSRAGAQMTNDQRKQQRRNLWGWTA